MQTEQISLHGYTVEIAQDECPENPFENWDFEPPLLTYYGGRRGYAKAYNDAPDTWGEILQLIPEPEDVKNCLTAILPECPSDEELEEWSGQGWRALAEDKLTEKYGSGPSGWRSACDWFELAESLLNYAGIPCLYEQSNGYSQGDSTLCLVVLTSEWLKKTGCKAENASEICKGTIELYSAWAWGDVYGVSKILAPGPLDEDGEETEEEELEHGSCWGFYGSNHEKSGLMDHVRDAIECHERHQKQEAENFTAALCSLE